MNRYRNSVSAQLLSAVLLVSSIVTVVTTGMQLSLNYRDAVNGLEDDLELIEKGYSAGIAQSMWEMNSSQIRAALHGVLHITGVQYVEITENDKVTFSAGKEPVGKTLSRSFPLDYQGRDKTVHLGKMRVIASLDHIYGMLQKTLLYIFLSQLIKTLIVSTLVLLIIRQMLIKHLISITDYLRTLDLSSQTDALKLSRTKDTKDELDILVGAINRMRTNLYQSYESLNTFNQQLENKVEERTQQLQASQQIITEQQKALIASAKLSALGEMAGGIAHEINNPLAAIQNLTYLIQRAITQSESENAHLKGKLNKDELEKMLSSMTSLTERIARIIQGLRDFSRDASSDPIHHIEVRQLIERTLSLCSERFKAHEIALIVDPLPNNLRFLGREIELSQALLSLLNNSFDAVQNHLGEKWIRLSAIDTGSHVEIRVTDSGLGIPAQIQKKLFQPFFTTKEIGKGTGLGLSIAFGILKGHRGELLLDESSAHTTFVIRLPMQPVFAEMELPN